jgi:hypothetical protein
VVARRQARLVAIAALVWITMSAARVGAQREDDEARREYQRGYKALAQGDCTQALVHYRRSLELSPRPRTLFNIAVCEESLGHRSEAWRGYRAFLQIAEERDASIALEANARIAALTAELRGTVTIESSPPGASVRVDDEREARGTTPITLSLEPGTHSIRVTLPDAVPAERSVDVIPEELTVLTIALEPPPVAVDPPTVPALVESAPVERVQPVTAPGGLPWRHTPEDEILTVELEPARPSSKRRTLGWGLGGLGAAGIAGGAVLGVLALRDVSDASGDHDRGKRRALASDGLIVAGTVAVVVAWRLLRRAP